MKANKQAQRLENHKLLIERLDLEKQTKKAMTKKQLKRLANYYNHSLKDAKITAQRVGISII